MTPKKPGRRPTRPTRPPDLRLWKTNRAGAVWVVCESCLVAWKLLGYLERECRSEDYEITIDLPDYCERCSSPDWTAEEVDRALATTTDFEELLPLLQRRHDRLGYVRP